MGRVPVGASRGLRWGCLGLAAVMALLCAAADPAEARSKRKRYHAKKPIQASVYNPPSASIVIDAKTGATLHQVNPDSLRHPASLTKIMTLYLLFERLEAGRIRLDTPLEVSDNAAAQPPTKLGLRPGQTITVEDAILGLVTKSANDAAVVVAEALAGSEEEFARQMTRKARALGMERTTYRNASGLPNDEQVTTARDQALLGIAIQGRFPRYYRYFSTASFEFRGRLLRNHNRLLGRVEGVDGIKTGYTRASGFNLVTSMRRGDRHIVAVVLGGRTSRQRDALMRDLVVSNIAQASTRRTVAFAEGPKPTPEGLAEVRLASAASTPVALGAPRPIEATATIPAPRPGSAEPIKPIRVRTVSVKLVPPRETPAGAAKAPSASAPVATTQSAPAIAAPSAPPRPAVLGTLPAAIAAAEQQAASAAAPVQVRQAHARGGWAIQVGAFEDESEAKERLSAAQSKAARLLGKADPYTERTIKGEKTFYRARFAGFDRDQAQAACRQLKRNDIVCMALKI
jgi:D-alanyl-D-alanine carboxypeptidase